MEIIGVIAIIIVELFMFMLIFVFTSAEGEEQNEAISPKTRGIVSFIAVLILMTISFMQGMDVGKAIIKEQNKTEQQINQKL